VKTKNQKAKDKKKQKTRKSKKQKRTNAEKQNMPGSDRMSDIKPARQDMTSIFTW
jgi:hypothetical protein